MSKVICGHTARGFSGESFTCYLPAGHKGWHEESVRLRDGYTSRTNWGDDGKNIRDSKDDARRHGVVAPSLNNPEDSTNGWPSGWKW